MILTGLGVAILLVALILRPSTQTTPPPAVPFEPFAVDEVPDGGALFEIQPFSSEARFILDELLRGTPKTVIGSTDEVGGQLIINFRQPREAQFSNFVLLADTLKTDSSFRDSALRDRILFTNEFPLMTFQPEQIEGLPDSVTVGEAVQFTISGPLVIKDVTLPQTFEVTATAVSPTEITLFATTQIDRTAYGLTIPNVPGVANVDEMVLLELDLVLTAVE